ncbi:MAG: DUF2201 family putative metallopeptidase [Acidimicrobiales bacterium]
MSVDRRKLAAARLAAANRYPYLASALFATPIIDSPGIGTVAIDESWRLYVDPAVVAALSVDQLAGMLVHHASHLLRDHSERAKAAGVDQANAGHWLDAADAEINDDADRGSFELPEDHAKTPEDLGCERGRLAEEYFHHTQEAEQQSRDGDEGDDAREGGAGGEGESGEAGGHEHDHEPGDQNCGSGADGQPREWDAEGGADKPKGIERHSQDLLRRQTAEEIRNHARSVGDVPAGLLRWAEQLLRPQVDWRRALAAELRQGVANAAGKVDYTYQRPSRRAGAAPDVVLPALRRPVPDVAVVCDTSASMDDDLLGRVLGEVEGILRTVGVKGQSVRVIACDTKAQAAQRVTSARQVQLLGGGGTDMGAGIDAAMQLKPRPAVVVVLTDGYTPWPGAGPKHARVIVGLLDPSAPAPPGWARTVVVDEEAA